MYTGTCSENPILPSMENETPVLEPVLSISRHDFDSSYEKLEEIGRGGFSVVYKCRNRISGEIFAVKV